MPVYKLFNALIAAMMKICMRTWGTENTPRIKVKIKIK